MTTLHSSFDTFNLHAALNHTIKGAGLEVPTPIQSQSIPLVLDGGDVLGLAQTGTGKTAAFLLPTFHSMLQGEKLSSVSVLIVVPTRELADQVLDQARKFTVGTKIRSTAVYGGVSQYAQIQRLRKGVEVLIACPGRLLDLLDRRIFHLKNVKTLVLDEADQMFDMGFLPAIRRIKSYLPAERQTLMFSATMPNDVRRLADEMLRSPRTVKADDGGAASTVTHVLYPVPHSQKAHFMATLLGQLQADSALIFTRTKRAATKLSESLNDAGVSAVALQGNLSQNRRQAVMSGFRGGKHRVLVATDIAARGIDVSSISHVVNYDMPQTVESYTHRVGRTGRALRSGQAISLVTAADELMIRRIERELKLKIERIRLEGFDYGMEGGMTAKDARQMASTQRAPRTQSRSRGDSSRGDSEFQRGPRRRSRFRRGPRQSLNKRVTG